MKKKQVIDRSGIALSRCPMFLRMAPPPASYQPARIPDETPAAIQRKDSRQRPYCFEFGISLALARLTQDLNRLLRPKFSHNFVRMSGKFQASSPQAPEEYQASKIQFHAQELLELGIWNFSGACPSSLRFDAVAPKLRAKAENLEFGAFPRSCKSLILLMIANNCRKLLGKKNIFMQQSKIRPGAPSRQLPTRADWRENYLILRLTAPNCALFKKIKSPINLKYETPAETQARLFHQNSEEPVS